MLLSKSFFLINSNSSFIMIASTPAITKIINESDFPNNSINNFMYKIDNFNKQLFIS